MSAPTGAEAIEAVYNDCGWCDNAFADPAWVVSGTEDLSDNDCASYESSFADPAWVEVPATDDLDADVANVAATLRGEYAVGSLADRADDRWRLCTVNVTSLISQWSGVMALPFEIVALQETKVTEQLQYDIEHLWEPCG